MQQHLALEKNPNETSIEAVLPGVIRRFDILDKKMDRTRLETKISLERVSESVIEVSRATRRDLVSALRHAAVGLETQEESGASRMGSVATERNPGLGDDMEEEQDKNNEELLKKVKNYDLKCRPVRSIKSIYNEFNGLDEFEGKPTAGGIMELERLYKTAWRKEYSSAEQKFFSRCMQVVLAIESERAKGKTLETVLEGFEEAFRDKKKSLGGFIGHLQSMGVIDKKSRRVRTLRQSPDSTGGGGGFPTSVLL